MRFWVVFFSGSEGILLVYLYLAMHLRCLVKCIPLVQSISIIRHIHSCFVPNSKGSLVPCEKSILDSQSRERLVEASKSCSCLHEDVDSTVVALTSSLTDCLSARQEHAIGTWNIRNIRKCGLEYPEGVREHLNAVKDLPT
jgi:hypothetical protein